MTAAIRFGTDGWRGIIAEDFTFENVRYCAQGVADFLNASGVAQKGLVVGYDKRFASEDFAAAAAEVVAANGVKVYLCDESAPTPVISYAILHRDAAGGIIITASHNPRSWNGLKYRGAQGVAAPPETLVKLEDSINRSQATGSVRRRALEEATAEGTIEVFDPAPSYLGQIGKLVDLEALRQSGLKIMVDSMFGAGAGYFATILTGGTAQITELHGERNPFFPGIRPEPIASNLTELCARLKESDASIGLATDGDADRIGIVDENGVYLTTQQVFSLLTLYLLEVRGQHGAIVRTITSSAMLDRLGQLYDAPVYQTPVGFKYVAPKMATEDALVGGEESGGYAYRGHVLERDGIVSGLFFLDLMARMKMSPSELVQYLYGKVGAHYYDRVDVRFPAEDREAIASRIAGHRPASIENTAVARIDTEDGYHFVLADNSWLLVRFSGTEPLLRIYAESDSPERVARLLSEGRRMAGVGS